ncbi:hypothetical protein E4U53_001801, partial [Claviceps sorghi]
MHTQCVPRPISNVSRHCASLVPKSPSTVDSPQPPSSNTAPYEPIEYHWIEDVEELENYQPGFYHPIMVGDLLHGRYRIVDKLGFGGYSTIWLAHDNRQNRFVAVKVGISSSSRLGRESRILRELSGLLRTQHASLTPEHENDVIPKILDEFEIQGPNGTHPCYTLIPTQSSLRSASFCCLFSPQVARALSAKLALAVSSIHSHGFVHG